MRSVKTTFITIFLILSFVFCANAEEILSIKKQDGQIVSFNIEIANTPGQRRQGLMYKKQMPEDYGMLFIFKKPKVIEMWMKNTYIPLDMLFIGEDNEIKTIAKNTTPESLNTISSGTDAIAVLEINAMITDKLGIAVGDIIIEPNLGKDGQDK